MDKENSKKTADSSHNMHSIIGVASVRNRSHRRCGQHSSCKRMFLAICHALRLGRHVRGRFGPVFFLIMIFVFMQFPDVLVLRDASAHRPRLFIFCRGWLATCAAGGEEKTNSHKAAAPKRSVRSNTATSAPKRRQCDKAVLKRPSRLINPASLTSEWLEFTPKTIDDQPCLARRRNNAYGGQRTRTQLNDNNKLCSAYQADSQRACGLMHGWVAARIPERKLLEFYSVRIAREAARLGRRINRKLMRTRSRQWWSTIASQQPTYQLTTEMGDLDLCNVGVSE